MQFLHNINTVSHKIKNPEKISQDPNLKILDSSFAYTRPSVFILELPVTQW